MKRHRVLLVLPVVLVTAAIAQAQQRSPNPQGGHQDPPKLLELLQLLPNVQGERGGGGRGAPPVVIRTQNGDRIIQAGEVTSLEDRSARMLVLPGAAWWTNAGIVARMGLTDDQKTRIERTFENHRQALDSSRMQLEKEEAQLGQLLDAEKVDRGAVLSQIDRVTQARSEMERTNAVMTLEMREVLTVAQWKQLPQVSYFGYSVNPDIRRRVIISEPNQVPPAGAGQRGTGQRNGQRQ